MIDGFANLYKELDSPGDMHYPLVASDTVDLPRIPRVIVALTSGVLVLRDRLGITIPYTVIIGDKLPFRAVRLMATGTSAVAVGWE